MSQPREQVLDDDAFVAGLAGSVLQPLITHYCAYLRAGRYAPNTIRVCTRCVALFAHWLGTEKIALSVVNETTGRRFLAGHLARCHCRALVRRVVHEHRAALAHLFRILKAAGVITPAPADHIGVEIARFERYMDGTCGLATSTRRQRGQIVTRFLAARFRPRAVTPGLITALDLRRFTLGTNQIRSPGTVRVTAGALRCYLRFREIEGDSVGDRRASIPGAGHWRLATLPAVLSPTQVDDPLAGFTGRYLPCDAPTTAQRGAGTGSAPTEHGARFREAPRHEPARTQRGSRAAGPAVDGGGGRRGGRDR